MPSNPLATFIPGVEWPARLLRTATCSDKVILPVLASNAGYWTPRPCHSDG